MSNRKLFILISVLIVASMLLAACGAPQPGNGNPQVAEPIMGAGNPASTFWWHMVDYSCRHSDGTADPKLCANAAKWVGNTGW